MKATELLEKQHRRVEQLFKRLEGSTGESVALVSELANQLAAHMMVEEQLFYPTVKEMAHELVLESFEEHAVARFEIKKLIDTRDDDEAFRARVATLKSLIEHHVEEEERELLPKVDEILSAVENGNLGRQLKEMFDEAVTEGFETLYGSEGKKKTKAARGHEPRARTKDSIDAKAHRHA
jgi:hemerythrin-like domain-containing protein